MDTITIQIRMRSSEQLCPHCTHILIVNEAEQCIECTHCGYIDCGDEEIKQEGQNPVK